MTADQFFMISQISAALTKRNITDKVKIDFRQVLQIKFTSQYPQHVSVKLSHEDSEPWKLISFQKRGRPTRLQEIHLDPLHHGPVPIAKAKADDVKSLLQCVPPIYHGFYNDIVVDKKLKIWV